VLRKEREQNIRDGDRRQTVLRKERVQNRRSRDRSPVEVRDGNVRFVMNKINALLAKFDMMLWTKDSVEIGSCGLSVITSSSDLSLSGNTASNEVAPKFQIDIAEILENFCPLLRRGTYAKFISVPVAPFLLHGLRSIPAFINAFIGSRSAGRHFRGGGG